MSCKTFSRTLIAFCGAVLLFLITSAEAQIVRRYGNGGVAVRAPFVRVDVGPYGGTSVRAPFVAVDDPGGVRLGRRQRRWLRRHPEMAESSAEEAPKAWQREAQAQVQDQNRSSSRTRSMRPTPAQSQQPQRFPTIDEMAGWDDATLIQALQEFSTQLAYSMERFDKADGWQRYLAIPYDALGSPGAEASTLQLEMLQKQLARYDKVATGAKFAKISSLPSFAPTHAALMLVVERFNKTEPATEPAAVDLDPFGDNRQDPGPVTESDESETLPTPPPSPEPRSGQRSILKRR